MHREYLENTETYKLEVLNCFADNFNDLIEIRYEEKFKTKFGWIFEEHTVVRKLRVVDDKTHKFKFKGHWLFLKKENFIEKTLLEVVNGNNDVICDCLSIFTKM